MLTFTGVSNLLDNKALFGYFKLNKRIYIMILAKYLKTRNVDTKLLPPEEPGVYKWWCSEEVIDSFISQMLAWSNQPLSYSKELIKKEMEYNDNLYCFYVGKADENGLKRRIKGDHLSNNPKGSTLRQSIYSLKYGKYFSTEENKIRNKTYVENIL